MARRVEDIAWAAGLFEGEGSCTAGISGRGQPRVSLTMTDEDVVLRFQSVIGFGTVRNYRYPPNKRFWVWSVAGKNDVLAVLDLLVPLLGERRQEQARKVRARAVDMVPRDVQRTHCRRGHSFAVEANVYVHKKTGKRSCRVCRSTYHARRLSLG